MTVSPEGIELADLAEEQAAAMSLRSARDKDELITAWWSACDHFQDEYAERLRQFAPMQAAG